MDHIYSYTVLAIVGFPAVSFLLQAIFYWFNLCKSEKITAVLVSTAFLGSVAASILATIFFWIGDSEYIAFSSGTSFVIQGHSFVWSFFADRLSLAFSLLCSTLIGLIGFFSVRYMHRERGFYRFYLLLTLFGASVQLIALAGTINLMLVGWELVGLSSVLLIAFYNERVQPLYNGLRAYCTYRVCDIGLILVVIIYNQVLHNSTFLYDESGYWGVFPVPADPAVQFALAISLLIAVMGKSALFPLGGWLPRAMEGPTPSSAIFYGAISIHIGPILLLRSISLLEASPAFSNCIIVVGVVTALYATLICRVQSDIKNTLAYASMTQVGLIIAEIGFGLYLLALAHCIGHAIYRTLQILQSPNIIQNHEKLEREVGQALPYTGSFYQRVVPAALQSWLYRYSLERGYIDSIFTGIILAPLLRLFLFFDNIEQRWVSFLAGRKTDRGGVSSE